MKQSGMALIEALLAASLLGLGLLGATRLVTHALGAALQTRQQELALALARETLDCAVARVAPCPRAERVNHQGVTYTVLLQVRPQDAHLSELSVSVDWQDSLGPQRILVRSRISDMPDWLGLSLP